MLKINDFIEGINQSIISAHDSLAIAHLALLEKYFEIVPSVSPEKNANDLQKDLHEMLANASDSTNPAESLHKILDVFAKFQKTSQAPPPSSPPSSEYRARTVVLQYPERTEQGYVMRSVSIPLIALVPITMSEISEAKFKTNFDILYDGNDMKVAFPTTNNTKSNETSDTDSKVTTNTSLEITLTPSRGTGGFQKLIEGYEQLLRSQLPQ